MLDLLGWGLRPVELAEQRLFESYFSCLSEPVSDYTFSQLFTWRNSLRIAWKQINGHLCVFANGTGDLTLLMPPIGDGDPTAALNGAFEIMDQYNSDAGVPDHSRVEYVSDELLERMGGPGRFGVRPLGGDFVYSVGSMIDLSGGDLASKRQARNRFLRRYPHRVEMYDAAAHLDGCLNLLTTWKADQDQCQCNDTCGSAIKRQKESLAAELTLRHAGEIGLRGMVVYVVENGAEAIRGFTFGEPLGGDQSSIVIEKTDLAVTGLAQFIYSEFCGRCWADRPFVNAGDDWGLPSLAWTKRSYRPVKMMNKYILTQPSRIMVDMKPEVHRPIEAADISSRLGGNDGGSPVVSLPIPVPSPEIRAADDVDIAAVAELEKSCFKTFQLSARRLSYLRRRRSAIFLVAAEQDRVIGEGIALIRRHRTGRISGRIYSLAVSETCRGRRIGRTILQRILSELSQRGAGRVYLEVDAANAAAIRLYEQHGFRHLDELRDYYGAGRHAVHMVRG